MRTIRNITVNALEWFDSHNGNSYFSAVVFVMFADGKTEEVSIPPQYGYGDHNLTVASQRLNELGYIKADRYTALWRYCEENGIKLQTSKIEVKRERDI